MVEKGATKNWIPLRDYLTGGVRLPRQAPAPTDLQGVPDTWVPLWDYWIEGVRKARPLDEKTTIVYLKDPKSRKPVAAEAWLTVDEVIADIQAIFALSNVPPRVEDLRLANQQELTRGEISEEEWQYRDARLEEIQEGHFIRLEEIVQWYVDAYFRDFGAGAPQPTAH
ncbi:MAG: hypothetical protein H7837_03775 [Magnetococcus sp. MYC-9]